MIISRPCALRQTFAGSALSGFLSLRRRFHLLLSSPRAKYVAPDRKGPRASGHTWFVLSRAEPSNVTSASGMPVERTYLKRNTGNAEDSLCNWVQLTGVNVLLVLCGTTDLCEDSAIFNCLVHHLFCRSAHHWGIFIQQSFEFMERQAKGFHLRELISWRGWVVAKVRTVSFAENRTSRDPLCFPMTMASVLFNQICAGKFVIMTDSIR